MEVDTEGHTHQGGSDSLSNPASPGITIEMDSRGGVYSDNVFMQSPPKHGFHTPQPHRSRSAHGSDPTSKLYSQGASRLNVPEQGWYRGQRSVSPASPRISPSPKAMKPATPNLSIHVTPDTPEMSHLQVPYSKGSQPMSSPRSIRHRQSGPPSSRPQSSNLSKQSTPSMQGAPKQHMLKVPSPRTTKDVDSLSSLSSGYYPGSSRSGTASPSTPDTMQGQKSWYLETPPDSPNSKNAPGGFSKEASPSPFHRTSSTSRPLAMQTKPPPPQPETEKYSQGGVSGGGSSGGLQWQQQSWNQWRSLAQDNGQDFNGQETLV